MGTARTAERRDDIAIAEAMFTLCNDQPAPLWLGIGIHCVSAPSMSTGDAVTIVDEHNDPSPGWTRQYIVMPFGWHCVLHAAEGEPNDG